MVKQFLNPDRVARPTGPYSQVAVTTGGKLVFILGQVALDASAWSSSALIIIRPSPSQKSVVSPHPIS
jgi:enamine deaminase RidA (YjgF/YER057c/UK114 family)